MPRTLRASGFDAKISRYESSMGVGGSSSRGSGVLVTFSAGSACGNDDNTSGYLSTLAWSGIGGSGGSSVHPPPVQSPRRSMALARLPPRSALRVGPLESCHPLFMRKCVLALRTHDDASSESTTYECERPAAGRRSASPPSRVVADGSSGRGSCCVPAIQERAGA